MNKQIIYCPQCGDPAPLGQKFCEKCGAKLPQSLPGTAPHSKPTSNASTLFSSPIPGMPDSNTVRPVSSMGITQKPGSYQGLFDKRHMAYVVKEKFWDWGSGPIYDINGNEIGKMKRKIFSIRKKIEFQELDGTISAYISLKLLAFKPTYNLFDPLGNLLGRFEKTLFSFLHPKFYFKNPTGQIIFTARGNFGGFDFYIYRGNIISDSNIVAEIHKADRWRDLFFGGLWDYSDTYGVKVIDPNVDRRLLLGFVIAIDNVLHDM